MDQGEPGLETQAASDIFKLQVPCEDRGTKESGAVGIVPVIFIGMVWIGGYCKSLSYLK